MLRKAIVLVGAVTLVASVPAGAQTKVIPGAHQTVKATVEAVDPLRRSVTVRMATGELRTVYASDKVTRLAEVKPGDTVVATYYDNIVVRKKAAGEPEVDTRQDAKTPGQGARPGGTAASQQTITATIDAIDANVPSISFKGPRGFAYSSKVQDREALQQVAVGDRVDITWTEATLISVAPPTK